MLTKCTNIMIQFSIKEEKERLYSRNSNRVIKALKIMAFSAFALF